MRNCLIISICLLLTGCNIDNNTKDRVIENNKIPYNEVKSKYQENKNSKDRNIQMVKYLQDKYLQANHNNNKIKNENDFIKARNQEFEENATKFHRTKEMREEYKAQYGYYPNNYRNYNGDINNNIIVQNPVNNGKYDPAIQHMNDCLNSNKNNSLITVNLDDLEL